MTAATPRRARPFLLLAALLLPALAACGGTEVPIPGGLSSLKVRFEQGTETGSADAPLLIPEEGSLLLRVTVEAIDVEGGTVPDYAGHLRFQASHGFVGRGTEGVEERDVEPGQTVEIELFRGYDDVRILAEDTERYVMGASDPLTLPPATLTTLQKPASSGLTASPWDGAFVRVASGSLIVTHVTIGGIFVSDAEGTAYNHLYVYTHSMPWLRRGDRLLWIAGSVGEFYGLTEMNFPDWEVGEFDADLARSVACAPPLLTAENLKSKAVMESYEGGLIRVPNVRVASWEESNFFSYGQWTAGVSDETGQSAEITVILSEAVAGYLPWDHTWETYESMTGNLRQHFSADPEWILVPRDPCDIVGLDDAAECPDDCLEAGN